MKVTDLDSSSSLAVDAFGNVYITVRAGSSEFPVTAGAYDVSYNGLVDAYVSKFSGLYCQPGAVRKGFWLLDANGNGVWDGTPKDDKYAGNGTWEGSPKDKKFKLGTSADVPVAGDWNGDGLANIGVFKDGTWTLDTNGNGKWDGASKDRTLKFGMSGDKPVVGKW